MTQIKHLESRLVNKADRNLLTNTGLVAVDALAAAVDSRLGGLPLPSGAWGLAKALIGNGLAIRSQKALEWVEMINESPSVFTKQLLETSEFQDAFVVSLENYIKERSDKKRSLLRAVFKGYASAKDPEAFPLERFNTITVELSLYDGQVFIEIIRLRNKLKIHNFQPFQRPNGAPSCIGSVFHLISLGLLIQDVQGEYLKLKGEGITPPFFFVSHLGEEYLKYILEVPEIRAGFAA